MIGIILFAYGGPKSIDDLLDYYTNIYHGKVPSEERMESVREKYRHIGEGNLLGAITRRQGLALEHALQPYFKEKVKSYVAFKYTPPFIEDTVKKMAEDGVDKIITFPIKPLYSKMGIRFYQRQVRKTLEELQLDLPIVDIEHWHEHEDFIKVIASRVQDAIDWLPNNLTQEESIILFTAHSMPGLAKTHQVYIDQFTQLAELVAKELNLTDWDLAFRSLGEKKEMWIGPDVSEVIRKKAEQGYKGIVACDLLSVTSNLEVLYDIGFDLQDLCNELGVEFVRATFLNDSYDFIQVLKKLIIEIVAEEAKDWLQLSAI